MSAQIISASYNDALTVNFTNDAWFNATEVAKAFDKKTNEWLRLESTKEYINCLQEMAMRENPASVQNQLVKTEKGGKEGGGGSWFHPKLAVAFARWLDVKFSIWCDMRIEKILNQAPAPKDDPLKLQYCTKAQREPLIKAVRRLVATAAEKGRPLSYSDAHSIINMQMGVDTVEELTPEQIPKAISMVGEIFKKIVLEGEYLPKGEATKAEQPLAPEYITAAEANNIDRVVGAICDSRGYKGAWSYAIWAAMRSRTACKSPQKFEVKHLPLIADELKNIVGVVDKLRIHEHKLEKAVLKSIRTGGDIDAIIAKEESSYSEDLKAITDTINIKLNEWRQRELAAIPARLEA